MASRKFTLNAETAELSLMRIFSDDFSSNAQNWLLMNDNTGVFEIKDGYYYLDNKLDKKARIAKRGISISNDRDFIIDCSMKKISGLISYGYGLTFGKVGMNDPFRISISADGFYKISKKVAEKTEIIKDWSPSTAINMGPNAENRVVLLKKGTNLHLYINAVLVYSVENFNTAINEIGFYIDGLMKVGFNDLNISYLVKPNERKAPPPKR